ncbi:MAG: hypothetical protein WAW52_04665 [Methanothrix sp.]
MTLVLTARAGSGAHARAHACFFPAFLQLLRHQRLYDFSIVHSALKTIGTFVAFVPAIIGCMKHGKLFI